MACLNSNQPFLTGDLVQITYSFCALILSCKIEIIFIYIDYI